MQGDRDGTVDWRYNVPRLERLFPEARVRYVEGAGHQLANESEALRADYLSDVTEYLMERSVPLVKP